MKKTGKIGLVLLLCLMFSVTVSADVQRGQISPDYTTDYYMIVESKPGGIDIYSNPDLSSAKLNEELIPNGTALYIEGEVEDKENHRTWGYVTYHGMKGFVPLDDCRPAQSRKEAIDSELYIAGSDNVNYNTDYDIKAYTQEGTQSLYQGPGEKYGTVPGVREIKNGETLHITQDAELVDGSRWGVTTVDGKEGWVNLDNTEEAAASTAEFIPAGTAAPTVTAAMEATTAPTATATMEATTAPTATDAPKETEASTAATVTVVEETAEASEEAEVSIEMEDSQTAQDAASASSQEVVSETESSIPAPFLWIAAAAVLAVAGIIIYHFTRG